jgi:hypothetical protein
MGNTTTYAGIRMNVNESMRGLSVGNLKKNATKRIYNANKK